MHKALTLPDPDPVMTPEKVLEYYANTYPELTVASVSGPEIKGTEAIYTFKVHLGEKG